MAKKEILSLPSIIVLSDGTECLLDSISKDKREHFIGLTVNNVNKNMCDFFTQNPDEFKMITEYESISLCNKEDLTEN